MISREIYRQALADDGMDTGASKATSPKEEQSRSPYQQIVTMHPHLDERRSTD